MAYFIGSVYTDSAKKGVSGDCQPSNTMGKKCTLTTGTAKIEAIRFTNQMDSNNRPILEIYELNEDIDEDGSFVFPVPMNMEYVFTNEYGENEVTNDPNKGIPTSACYRFRVTLNDTLNNGKRTLGSYLVPNIREYGINENEIDKSYTFSLDWNEYPNSAINNTVIFNNINGSYYPKDYFFRLTYNKVYTLSSFMGSYFSDKGIRKDTFLGLKELSPKTEDDCENSVLTPPVNWGIQNITFAIILATTINIFERITYTAFISAIQILIIPFQALYNWEIKISVFNNVIFHYWPFNVDEEKKRNVVLDVDRLVIEPLQRFGTLHLGLITYPECEQCNNENGDDNITESTPDTRIIDLTEKYKLVSSGVIWSDKHYLPRGIVDDYPEYHKLYITVPTNINPQPVATTLSTVTFDQMINNINVNPLRYIIRLDGVGDGELMNVYPYYYSGVTYYYIIDYNFDPNEPEKLRNRVEYEVVDVEQPYIIETTPDDGESTINDSLPSGCGQYMTVYDEDIVSQTYCVDTLVGLKYSGLTINNLQNGYGCSGGKLVAGQVISKTKNNPCKTCTTKSGFSEFREGKFAIIPATSQTNRDLNRKAIKEYARRKLVGKLFCEGIVNYSFMDNWLSGSLYFFPFWSKVRWDNEETLDLNHLRTVYCKDLVYYKVKDKRFYYRSTYYLNNNFLSYRSTLGHPTTMVDLGPRDEFIKEICIDPSLDPNCSVVRNIGPSSYQDFKEMLGLYVNYKMDALNTDATIKSFFENHGFDKVIQTKMKNSILNGDILQLISMNNEVGIDGFDLQKKHYSVYNPLVLDPEAYPDFFKAENGNENGPLPLQLKLDDDDGYRVRVCLNEPGRLTDSSQEVPFYLWNKKGLGFGSGVNQSWDYRNDDIAFSKPLQGMSYEYKYNDNTSDSYVLFPMTKTYTGQTITLNTPSYTRFSLTYDVEYLNKDSYGDLTNIIDGTHLNYDNQEEGFTFLYITNGDGSLLGATDGILYTRIGSAGNWSSLTWSFNMDYIITPTTSNYYGVKQILSTPFLFYFGLRPGKTAIDKFIKEFGPKGAFTSVQ